MENNIKWWGENALQMTPSALDKVNLRRLLVHADRDIFRIHDRYYGLITQDEKIECVRRVYDFYKSRGAITDFEVTNSTSWDHTSYRVAYNKRLLMFLTSKAEDGSTKEKNAISVRSRRHAAELWKKLATQQFLEIDLTIIPKSPLEPIKVAYGL